MLSPIVNQTYPSQYWEYGEMVKTDYVYRFKHSTITNR